MKKFRELENRCLLNDLLLHCFIFFLEKLRSCVPVKQGAEFDNVEEDGHLSSGLIFKVGKLGES